MSPCFVHLIIEFIRSQVSKSLMTKLISVTCKVLGGEAILCGIFQCKRLFETLQRQQKTPKWAPRETEFFLVSVRKLGISDLELLAGIMGTKTAQQIEQFLPEARIKFRLDDLLDKEKLERYASGLVSI